MTQYKQIEKKNDVSQKTDSVLTKQPMLLTLIQLFHCFPNSTYFPDVTVRWRAGVSVSRAEPGAGRARASMSSGLTTPRTSRSHSTSPPRPGSRTRSGRHPLGSQVSSLRESFVVPRVKLLASKFIYNAQISFPGHRTSLSWEQQQNVLSSLYLFHVKFLPLLRVAWP